MSEMMACEGRSLCVAQESGSEKKRRVPSAAAARVLICKRAPGSHAKHALNSIPIPCGIL